MADRTCISCGLPIRSSNGAARGSTENSYCLHCSNEDGTMKCYNDVKEGMAQFIVRTQGLDTSVAHEMAGEMMKNLPAWSNNAK